MFQSNAKLLPIKCIYLDKSSFHFINVLSEIISLKSDRLELRLEHVEDVTSYRLRNAGNYVGIHANTRTYANSFLPSTIHAWNNLPDSIRSADLSTFLLRTLPKYPNTIFLVTDSTKYYTHAYEQNVAHLTSIFTNAIW